MKETMEALVPQYIKNFKCIGPDCEDSCCHKWGITVDKKSYEQFLTVKDVGFRNEITSNITITDKKSRDLYAKMKMDKNGRCTMLDKDGWCRIHSNLGAEYLPEVCNTYPRFINKIDNIYELSGYISCPEISRLALLNEKPMEFDMTTITLEGEHRVKINLESEKYKGTWIELFWPLRIFTISLLQDRRYTFSERLTALGVFYQKIDECIENNKFSRIQTLIDDFTKYRENGSVREFSKIDVKNSSIKLMLLKNLCDIKKDGLEESRKTVLNKIIEGIGYQNDKSDIENRAGYEERVRDYFVPFEKANGYMIENFIVNTVFKNMFPITGRTPFSEYCRIVVYYSIIKFFVTGLGAFEKNTGVETGLKALGYFSRIIEHDTEYLDGIIKLMEEDKLMNLPFMIYLLK